MKIDYGIFWFLWDIFNFNGKLCVEFFEGLNRICLKIKRKNAFRENYMFVRIFVKRLRNGLLKRNIWLQLDTVTYVL